MAILPILAFPDERLKQVCSPVEFSDRQLPAILKDLKDTLLASSGCVGIAAPQIGILKRIVLVDASRGKRQSDNHGFLALINPTILCSAGKVTAKEGCLSIPDLTANVTRAQSVTVSFQNANGHHLELNSKDFEARIIQHEMDHLDGILFLDRVSCLKTDVFRRHRFSE